MVGAPEVGLVVAAAAAVGTGVMPVSTTAAAAAVTAAAVATATEGRGRGGHRRGRRNGGGGAADGEHVGHGERRDSIFSLSRLCESHSQMALEEGWVGGISRGRRHARVAVEEEHVGYPSGEVRRGDEEGAKHLKGQRVLVWRLPPALPPTWTLVAGLPSCRPFMGNSASPTGTATAGTTTAVDAQQGRPSACATKPPQSTSAVANRKASSKSLRSTADGS